MKSCSSKARKHCIIFAISTACASLLWGGMTQIRNNVEQKEFTVVGISARTTNAQEAAGKGVIAKQWDRFYKEGILDKIPNRTDSAIYAVYCDYASDRNGEYAFIIGGKVGNASDVPAGMVARTVSAGKYAVITSEKGPMPKNIVEAWQTVWSPEDQARLGGKRAYKTDFEVYDERASNPQDSQIDIYVGVK